MQDTINSRPQRYTPFTKSTPAFNPVTSASNSHKRVGNVMQRSLYGEEAHPKKVPFVVPVSNWQTNEKASQAALHKSSQKHRQNSSIKAAGVKQIDNIDDMNRVSDIVLQKIKSKYAAEQTQLARSSSNTSIKPPSRIEYISNKYHNKKSVGPTCTSPSANFFTKKDPVAKVVDLRAKSNSKIGTGLVKKLSSNQLKTLATAHKATINSSLSSVLNHHSYKGRNIY